MEDTVTIACKLPSGLHLEVNGRRVTVKGNAHQFGIAPPGQASGGYALTPGVSKDFWEAWLKIHGESDVVRKGLIFSSTRTIDARARGTEQAAVRSGFEGIEPEAPGAGLEQIVVA